MGRQIGAVDPITNGPADKCRGSYCPMGRQIGAVDPTTNGPADRCRRSYCQMTGR
jgi:hypothetical protein